MSLRCPAAPRSLAAALSLLLLPIGCAPDDRRPQPQVPVEESVVAALTDSGNETFLALVDAAGLRPELTLPGPYTLFAPDDAAFAALPPRFLEALRDRRNRHALRDLLRYHIVPDSLALEQFEGEMSFTSLQAEALTIARDEETDVTLTDAQGRTAHVRLPGHHATNGVVYSVDRVLFHVPSRVLLRREDVLAP